jgi:cobalt-zinc-cadmium efflux system protein
MSAHDHHHGHDHAHGASGHSHAPASFGRAFAIGTAINAGFVAAQVLFGILAHSMALLADAVHNLGDVLGLLIAWGAAVLAQRHPTPARTYGWGRGTILASLTNAVVLLFSCGAIALEALRRFGDPTPVGGATVIWVAVLGIVINGATAMMFARGRKDDLNIKGAYMHMAADAGVSAGVVLAGLLILLTGWHWVDPVSSLMIVAVIIIGTWSLLRDSVNLAMDAVPEGIDLAEVESALRALPGVADVHDLHVWGLSTTQTAVTAHLVHDGGGDPALVRTACLKMRAQFGIGHATFQVETAAHAEICELRPADVV